MRISSIVRTKLQTFILYFIFTNNFNQVSFIIPGNYLQNYFSFEKLIFQ